MTTFPQTEDKLPPGPAEPSGTMTSILQSVFELLGSGLYQVPWHQRLYDWEKKHVKMLLEDIRHAHRRRKDVFFMGVVVFRERKKDDFEINDGQQRLITLSLILAYLVRRFSKDPMPESAVQENQIISMLFNCPSPHNARWENRDDSGPRGLADKELRLNLRERDLDTFETILRGAYTKRNGKMKNAWEVIRQTLEGESEEALNEFFLFLRDKVTLCKLVLPRAMDANAVFETINARGKALDSVDLVRNYCYYRMNEASEANRKQCHKHLENVSEILKPPRPLQKYTIAYFRCKFGHFSQEKDFYWEWRQRMDEEVSSPEAFLEIVKTYTRTSYLNWYNIIRDPQQDTEKRLKKISNQVREGRKKRNLHWCLGELREYTVTHSLVLACLIRYDAEREQGTRIARHVFDTLYNLTSFVMRSAFVTENFKPSRFESKFDDLACEIFNDTLASYDFLRRLQEVCFECDKRYGVLDDKRFEEHMESITSWSSNKKTKALLLGIEGKHFDFQDQEAAVKESSSSLEIGCILPEDAKENEGWDDFYPPEDSIHRLGNLVLLRDPRKEFGRKNCHSFREKRNFLQSSSFKTTRMVAKEVEWTPEKLCDREDYLIDQAVKTWDFTWDAPRR